MGYFARRALSSLILLFGISILVFSLTALAPGDFFSELQLDPTLRAQAVEGLRAQYGVDRPLVVRYGAWVHGLLRGDWGVSLAYHVPVWPLIRERAGNTLLITISATIFAWVLALGLGTWSAQSRGQVAQGVVEGAIVTLLGTPELLLCLLLMMLAVRSGIFPAGGMSRVDSDSARAAVRIGDTMWHMVLPVTALTLAALPVLFRHVRAAVAGALESEAVRTARAVGIPGSRILLRHVLPMAANPLLMLFGLSIATLLSGSLVVEVVMGWPGLGPLLLESILARDLFVVIGIVMMSSLLLVAGNLLSDTLLFAVDPRTREGHV